MNAASYHRSSFKMAVLLVLVIAAQLAMLYGLADYEFDQDDEDENPVLHRPFLLDSSFDVRRYSDEYCVQEFLFNRAQLEEILGVLQVPPGIKSRNRDNADSLKVLYMTIYRLSYPARLNMMKTMFSRGTSAIESLEWAEAGLALLERGLSETFPTKEDLPVGYSLSAPSCDVFCPCYRRLPSYKLAQTRTRVACTSVGRLSVDLLQ